MNQAERVSDFSLRIDYSPDSVYAHRERDWRYIPIHPFADEPEILNRLELTPPDCLRALTGRSTVTLYFWRQSPQLRSTAKWDSIAGQEQKAETLRLLS